MMPSQNIIFKETQRFKQWWIWLFLILINGLMFSGFIYQVILGNVFGNQPMSDSELVVGMLLLLGVTIFILSFRLDTEIGDKGIKVRLFPIQLKFRFYEWKEIQFSIVRTYKPVAEYGGWGFRGRSNNRVLSLSGNQGLQLEFKDGKKLLINTQKGKELTDALIQLKRN